MKIGLVTDELANMSLDDVLDMAASLGIEAIELGCGAWSNAPHVDREALLGSDTARDELLGKLADRGLGISALNVSGNPLHPGPGGAAHDKATRQTIELARLLGIDRVVLMSGLPAAPGDRHPNWITVAWPRETAAILEHQWDEVFAYWSGLVAYAVSHGISRLCVEPHGHQIVYNVPSLLRLRDAVGPVVGANFDPSHLMWMGADPIAAIEALGDAIYHVHAKDTKIEAAAALRSRLEVLPAADAPHRAWNYVTLGHGHDMSFWRSFCDALRGVGYDDVLSIEHEDVALDPLDGVQRSVSLLKSVIGP